MRRVRQDFVLRPSSSVSQGGTHVVAIAEQPRTAATTADATRDHRRRRPPVDRRLHPAAPLPAGDVAPARQRARLWWAEQRDHARAGRPVPHRRDAAGRRRAGQRSRLSARATHGPLQRPLPDPERRQHPGAGHAAGPGLRHRHRHGVQRLDGRLLVDQAQPRWTLQVVALRRAPRTRSRRRRKSTGSATTRTSCRCCSPPPPNRRWATSATGRSTRPPSATACP